ncbi:hypothetical protein K2173_017316 [Erythroxylum novogranatense]|uniref:INO80 complex subunit B-like conserved region domain-containing protein n=1 Tax=Erythroxylum novogranatense TaxID=1862640 RepID=A0AAV8TK02_9ROSI|nr:hypothetical protein K2173_017316 [Erythroxylum novogranatense]
MDNFGLIQFSGFSFFVKKKKRSTASRRPCCNPEKLLQLCSLLSLCTQYFDTRNNEDNLSLRERAAGSDGPKSENRLKKLKLKLGGITHTIHAKSVAGLEFSGGSYLPKTSQCTDAPHQDPSYVKDRHLRGKMPDESVPVSESCRHESVRKSKRVPKKRMMELGFHEEDDNVDDDEVNYLRRQNGFRISEDYEDELAEKRRRKQGTLKVSDRRSSGEWLYADMGNYTSKFSADAREKGRLGKSHHGKGYGVEEVPISGREVGYKSRKLGFVAKMNELTSTEENLALQSNKDECIRSDISPIEFPNGLPLGPKKQTARLSELEQQLKKAEAAQRRRLQSEKAAKEAQAEAIRKILGQDSGRKKREAKLKKQRDELAQGKNAKMKELGSNTIRWVIGPNGTVVTFSDDIGLPHIFNTLPGSYPPPREKCAGPNCENAYKYRDSKSKLPLCSLQCYKAIHGQVQSLIAS